MRAQAQAMRTAGGVQRAAPAFSEAQTTLMDQPAFRRPRPFVSDQISAGAPDRELRYHTLMLEPDASAVGQEVRALALPPGVLLVTIEREHQTLAPQGATVLAAGDRITLFAPPQHLPAALEVLMGTSTRPVGSVHP